MLKQILQDMRVESEILNGLTDTEKQTLFCIMREEQIRRWRDWDQEQQQTDNDKKTKSKSHQTSTSASSSGSGSSSHDSTSDDQEAEDDQPYHSVNLHQHQQHRKKRQLKNRSVQFLLGEDGEPWVWVMGEHESDKSIEQILAEEAQQKAIQLAEQEAQELRKSVEAELTDIIEYQHQHQHKEHPFSLAEEKRHSQKKLSDDEINGTPIIDDLEIYCSVDELRERISAAVPSPKHNNNNSNSNNNQQQQRNVTHLNNKVAVDCNVLQEISNKPQNMAAKNTKKVAARVALWEHRLITERSNEILKGIQRKQLEKVKEAEEAARNTEELWMEQGMKSILC